MFHSIITTMSIEKDFHKGRRCFIVATGPSLAYKDLSFLKDEITIALNLAPITLDKFDIKPNYNIIADKFSYLKFKEVYKKLTYNTPVKKIIVASACETFPEELKDKNTFFFPKKLPQIADFKKNPLEEGFARGKTVAHDAIQLAYYLGFEEVYIIGMDMKMNNDWGKDGHCYEIHKNDKFLDLEFFKTKSHEIQRGLPGNPDFLKTIVDSFKFARKAFEEEGKKIINDSNSQLDVFEKEEIFKKFGNVKKIVAFVPAKGKSERVEGKNSKILGDKPLFLHVLDSLLSCRTIDEVYLDSEADFIFDLAKDRKHKMIKRDPSLATNKTDGNQLLLNEASNIDADIYVQILPTSPFLKQETIDEAVFKLLTSEKNDSAFAVFRDKFYLWDEKNNPINYDPLNIPNSVDLETTTIETMGMYLIRKETLFNKKSRIGDKPLLIEISFLESIDIDTQDDFDLADKIIRGNKNE